MNQCELFIVGGIHTHFYQTTFKHIIQWKSIAYSYDLINTERNDFKILLQ